MKKFLPMNDSALTIREFRPEDTSKTVELFQDTVRRVNGRDYSPEQIAVWASASMHTDAWRSRLEDQLSFVAESLDGRLLGFIAMELDGHIDLLYCHADYQRQGVGSRLLAHAEILPWSSGINRLYTEASITARLFFERHGFAVVEAQKVWRCGMEFVNYRMEKCWRTFAPEL